MPYLMEHRDEAARLVAKVNSADWFKRYLAAHVAAGARVLEVGCGPCHLLAAVPPDVMCIGIDISGDRLEAAASTSALRVQGDALRLPFASGRFDVVYSRFLFEYLADREDAIAEIARVVSPGGTVLLQDLDGQMVWHDGADQSLHDELTALLPMFEELGFDPFVGRKLRRLARDAGLVDVTVTIEPYHLIAGAIDPIQRAQWLTKLRIATPIVERLLRSHERALGFVERFMAHLDSPDTLTYSNAFTVVGRRPR
jgi:SAM-dependent methyltransferase